MQHEKATGGPAPDPLTTMTGLELLRAGVAGAKSVATIGRTLNFQLVEVGDGYAVFHGEPTDQFLNPLGIIHGGWALTLIDSACGCAGHTTLPAGVGYSSLETKVNFTRAITPQTGRVVATGKVLNRGRQVITTEASIVDGQGRLLAHGSSTLLILQPQS